MNDRNACPETSELPLRFASFEDNRHTHQGAVFILASGPSAADFPLRAFPDIPVIAMNGSILRCEEEAVGPLYYLCDDPAFIEGRLSLAIKGMQMASQTAMTEDCYKLLLEKAPEALGASTLYLLSRVNRRERRPIISDRRFAWSIRHDPHLHSYFSLFRVKPNRVGFSTNLAKGYFGSRTIPLAALQLACHLGFSKAYLIGVDLDAARGRFYEQGSSAMPSSLDECYEDYILPSFKIMAERAVVPGQFEVFNLSNSSRLPASVVPRMTVELLRSGSINPSNDCAAAAM